MSGFPTPIFLIQRQDLILIRNIDYCFHSTYLGGYVLERRYNPDLREEFSHDTIWQYQVEGRLEITRGYFCDTAAGARLTSAFGSFADLPRETQLKVLENQWYCDEFLALNGSDRNTYPKTLKGYRAALEILIPKRTGQYVGARRSEPRNPNAAPSASGSKESRPSGGEEIVFRRPPSEYKLQRKTKLYIAANRNPLALVDHYNNCGRRESPVDPEVLAIMPMYVAAYADERRPSKAKVYSDFLTGINNLNIERANERKRPLIPCSEKTFRKAINKLDRFDVLAARKGIEAARREYAIVGPGVEAPYPGALAYIDEGRLPLMTLLKQTGVWTMLSPDRQESLKKVGTLWVVPVIDQASRCVLGLSVTRTPNAAAALNALHLAVIDKSFLAAAASCGAPWPAHTGLEAAATDSGSGFISDEFRLALAGLRAKHLIGPAKHPQFRGTMERLFGTLHTGFVSNFTGRTFHNVVEKGDYDAEARASLDDDELPLALVRFIVDIYHHTPHEGLKGETPMNAWKRLVSTVGMPPPPNPNAVRVIFGIRLKRKPDARGIQVLGNHYQSDALQKWRRVNGDGVLQVSLDQFDLGMVSVKFGEDWVAVPAMDETLTGVPLTLHVQALATLRKKFGAQAEIHAAIVHAARRELMETSAAAIARAALGPTRPDARLVASAERRLGITIRSTEAAKAAVQEGGSSRKALRFATSAAGSPMPAVQEMPVQAAVEVEKPPKPRKASWIIKDVK